MAGYKVPQDVEADDKLIGPFSFRQFVYLLIAGGLIALAVALFQLFPLLAIIPIPVALLFLVLALPLKKEQPMETYLFALVSYYLKPRKRIWTSGQRESTILITAPKIVDEESRKRDLSGEEATRRLSFLANIVDTEGQAIKNTNILQDDFVAEASQTTDILDSSNYFSQVLNRTISQERTTQRQEAVREMREAIEKSESLQTLTEEEQKEETKSVEKNDVVEKPVENFETTEKSESAIIMPEPVKTEKSESREAEKNKPKALKPVIMDLANNSEYSIATIAKEANRINRKDDGEVYISLH